MKKLITLALAAAFVASSYAPASAVDVKVDARYQFQFKSSSEDFQDSNASAAGQRLRVGLTFVSSENLSGYLQVQVGADEWGAANHKHGDTNMKTRQSYIDWTIPSTDLKVRMGYQSISLPAFVTLSPVMDDMINAGIAVDVPVCDKLGLTAFWTRPYRDGNGDISNAKMDLFGIVGNYSLDNLTVSPWFMYASKDKDAYGDSFQGNLVETSAAADAFIAGFGSEWRPFDPFTVALDGAYGVVNYSQRNADVTRDQEGWYVAGKAAYALDFGTPALVGWFASGDSKGDQKYSGQLPAIYGDFNATSMFFDNAYGHMGGNRCTVGGTWGLGAQLNGVSFVENLSHDFSITYIGGTNSKYNGGYGTPYDYMTAEDAAVEFDFLTTWQIYQHFTAALDLSYIVEDFDTKYRPGAEFDNAWAASVCFQYRF